AVVDEDDLPVHAGFRQDRFQPGEEEAERLLLIEAGRDDGQGAALPAPDWKNGLRHNRPPGGGVKGARLAILAAALNRFWGAPIRGAPFLGAGAAEDWPVGEPMWIAVTLGVLSGLWPRG